MEICTFLHWRRSNISTTWKDSIDFLSAHHHRDVQARVSEQQGDIKVQPSIMTPTQAAWWGERRSPHKKCPRNFTPSLDRLQWWISYLSQKPSRNPEILKISGWLLLVCLQRLTNKGNVFLNKLHNMTLYKKWALVINPFNDSDV